MDELINLVTQKTGISRDQAQTAVNVVLNFLKERLPAPIASQIDSVASGKPVSQDAFKDMGGLFKK